MIRSMEEFNKQFLPKIYEEGIARDMTPEELGNYWAERAMKRVRLVIQAHEGASRSSLTFKAVN